MDIFSCTVAELEQTLISFGEKEFRVKQILEWLYVKGASSFSQMSNLSKTLREKLETHFSLSPLKLIHVQKSDDKQTDKFLFELHDGLRVEAVLIADRDRRTLCVSSQVGCNARCAFCASGKLGLKRNLGVGEIVEQVRYMKRMLEGKGESLTNIVFMGMGEPLDNLDAVVGALKVITHPLMIGMSKRRITVSTVGVVDGIYRLAEEGLGINLVLSLHAPNQMIRKKIIPYARKYPYEDVIRAMRTYAAQTKRDVTYEYILINGINDKPEDAEELAKVVKGDQCTVNLIPYNPVNGLKLERPTPARVMAFRKVLSKAGVRNTQRYTKGNDIAAACGQLAIEESLTSVEKVV